MRVCTVVVVMFVASSCATTKQFRPLETLTTDPAAAARCGGGKPMRVHFFDVRQALAALVELPDGERILVDTGDSRIAKAIYERMEGRLDALLGDHPISMLWITHQHADHLGRAVEVMQHFKVGVLVDNGTYGSRPDPVDRMRAAARYAGARVATVSPESPTVPLEVAAPVTLTAVLPPGWTAAECKAEPNDCSIGLRIDYCQSSVLFTGDAETHEEGSFTALAPVTLLQAGHHGSSTSSSAEFLRQVQPKYVLVSSGAPEEGSNKGYCHPSRSSVQRLTSTVGGTATKKLTSFKDDELRCSKSTGMGDWEEVLVSDSVYSTARDGHVTFTTSGDGAFEVETEATR